MRRFTLTTTLTTTLLLALTVPVIAGEIPGHGKEPPPPPPATTTTTGSTSTSRTLVDTLWAIYLRIARA